MSKLTDWMDRTWYPQYQNNWDDHRFRDRLLERIEPAVHGLEYGAGRGKLECMDFRGKAAFVAGVDPAEDVLQNPYLDEGKILPLPENTIAYEDNRFDVVFCDNVMEHVTDPVRALREIHRVLKPGGRFLAKTTNKWHYIPTIARFTPTRFHKTYNRLRGREEEDTFPTVYRCNARSAVKRLAGETGFEIVRLETWEGRPEYLRLAAPLYITGFVYERLMNSTNLLATFRCVLFFELRKLQLA